MQISFKITGRELKCPPNNESEAASGITTRGLIEGGRGYEIKTVKEFYQNILVLGILKKKPIMTVHSAIQIEKTNAPTL